MNGFFNHLTISLRLTFRNRQALIFSYLFPLAFLFMFGSIFHGKENPLEVVFPQILTMTALGASCFGVPTTLVTERERGIWRRYRLAPIATGWFVASTIVGRFVIIISSVILQVALAVLVYKIQLPHHPVELFVAFTLTCFAFIGLGLTIATVATSTASVQGLAQSIFMPVMLLGGVGIPLSFLPPFAQHISVFLPGRYGVEAMRSCVTSLEGLESVDALLKLGALIIIGGSACLVASKLFRWEAEQKMDKKQRWWLLLIPLSWAVVGLMAEAKGWAVIPKPPL